MTGFAKTWLWKSLSNRGMFADVIVYVFVYRVLKCDVIKMKFLKLWDLLGCSERTMSKRPTCQK